MKNGKLSQQTPLSPQHRLRSDPKHPWREENLGRLLLIAVDNWQAALVRGLQKAGFRDLRDAHMHLLRYIDVDGTRITEIAERAGVTKQAIGKMIATCEKLNLVRTIADPNDGRAKIVAFTKQSRAVIVAEEAVIRRIDEQLRARLGSANFAKLRTSLLAIADASDLGEEP
jgi:DNA-binding MarR family transcriptional regulator